MTKIVGVERDRAILRGVALRIIREILEKPLFMDKRDARRDWLAPPPLSTFTRLEPIGFGLDQDDFWVFHPKVCTPDVVWPLDMGMVCDCAGSAKDFAMSRFYTVTAKQVRGYASRIGPFMVREDVAQMFNGKLVTTAGLFVWLGGRWSDAQNRVLWEGHIPNRSFTLTESDRNQPAMATALALRQRYEWAVSLGLDSSPSIRFATDPTGIKEVFRIRDLPEGKDRREALMTWVTDHWRQDRNDDDIEVYVRKHLRGTTRFHWRGMNCELLPSQFDMDQRDRLQEEREAMKRAGTGHRVRK